MSFTAWNKRLRAIENRPSTQRPLRITGGMPSGAELIQSLAAGARSAKPPLSTALPLDDCTPVAPQTIEAELTKSPAKAREDPDRYRRKLLIQAKNQLPEDNELRKVTVNRLPSDALKPFEDQIYSACKSAAYSADSVPPGEFRRVVETDGNGNKIVKFIGQRSFIHDFTRPGRRVVSFLFDRSALRS